MIHITVCLSIIIIANISSIRPTVNGFRFQFDLSRTESAIPFWWCLAQWILHSIDAHQLWYRAASLHWEIFALFSPRSCGTFLSTNGSGSFLQRFIGIFHWQEWMVINTVYLEFYFSSPLEFLIICTTLEKCCLRKLSSPPGAPSCLLCMSVVLSMGIRS